MKSLSAQSRIDTLRSSLDGAEFLVKVELAGKTLYLASKSGSRMEVDGGWGAELVNGGDMSDSSAWWCGDGWVVSSESYPDVAHCDNTLHGSTYMKQADILTPGNLCEVKFTVKNYVSGSVRARAGSAGAGAWRSANGTYTEEIECEGDASLYIDGDATCVLDVDDVSVKQQGGGEKHYEGCILDVSPVEGAIDPFTLDYRPAAVTLTLANNVPVLSYERFSDIASDYSFEFAEVSIWWVTANSLSGDEVLFFRGRAEELSQITEEICRLRVTEFSASLEDRAIFTRLSGDDYPGADPDDIGKVIPIIYGSASKVRALAADAGSISNLTAGISDSVTTITLSDSSAFPASGTVQIDAEQITFAGNSNNQLTGCARGANGTDAVAHDKGAAVAEVQSAYVYLLADHPVKAISAVYVDDVRQTSQFTAYTGQAGDEYSGYGAKAVIVFNVRPTIEKQVNLEHTHVDNIGVNDGIGVNDNIGYTSSVTTKRVNPNSHTTGGSVTNPAKAYDGNESQYASLANGSAWLRLHFPSTSYGTISTQYVWAKLGSGTLSISGGWSPSYVSGLDSGGEWVRFSKSGGAWSDYFQVTGPTGGTIVVEVYKDVDYTPTLTKSGSAYKSGSATKTGETTGSLTGNTTAETVIGLVVAADAEGYRDDASGTYTGVAEALIERPDHIRKHMLIELYGLSTTEIDADSFDDAGTEFNTNSYTLAVVLDKEWGFAELARALAFQTRCAIFWSGGAERMVWLPDSAAADGDITRREVADYELNRTPRNRIRNSFTALYNRRWDRSGDEAYRDAETASDAPSQSKFGKLAETYRWDWITSQATAADVLDFWKTFFKRERWTIKAKSFWNGLKYEPGDVVTFGTAAADRLPLLDEFGTVKFRITSHSYSIGDDTVNMEAVEVD